MSAKIRQHWALVQQYGLKRCLYRFSHDLRQRGGRLKRRFPVWAWEDRPLSSWVRGGVPTDARGYREYRQKHARGFFFPAGRPPKPREEWQEQAIQQADAILNGRFPYFSRLTGELGFPDPDWFVNPFTGQRSPPDRHWCDRECFQASAGDIKYIWEPSRFCWVYSLVRAYAATGNEKYPEAFWTLLDSWMAANPPQMGPNWQCGQEVSLRVLACTFAMHAFWASSTTTDRRLARLVVLLAGSAERIAGNINFARAQMGNHATSEATGLYTIGMMLPELKDAERWRRRGAWVLEDEVKHFNWTDGSYTQHSMNYQRLMLHGYLWAMRLAQLNGEPFSPRTTDRLRSSYEFLYQLQDEAVGRLPNYGPNDGALILPLSNCDYLDYRPILKSMCFLLDQRRLYGSGPWDEDLLWLLGFWQ